MNISPRTKTLLDRLPDHPLTPSMRTAMIAAAAASEGFAGHKIALGSDRRMTPLGQRQALHDALRLPGLPWSPEFLRSFP
jgi:hypothetical protein